MAGPVARGTDALAGRNEQLRALHEMTEAISRAEDVEGIYDVALDGLTRALRADRASILLFDEAGVMRFRAWRGLSDEYRAEVDGHSPWAPDTVDADRSSLRTPRRTRVSRGCGTCFAARA